MRPQHAELVDGAEQRRRLGIVSAMGVGQILSWGCSYYLFAVLAEPIVADTGWTFSGVAAGLSLGLLVAAVISRVVGRTIDRVGGRTVLVAGAALLGLGLFVVAVSPSLPCFLAGWLFVGAGMGAGLYDAAFSTLGRLFGSAARNPITWLTLFGGFASTICWPLSALLVAQVGWRGTCLVYSAIELALVAPLYLVVLPADNHAAAGGAEKQPTLAAPAVAPRLGLYVLLATVIGLSSMLSTIISAHLLTLLTASGLSMSAAVGVGVLIGPSQVFARTVEMVLARAFHPLWTLLVATALLALGIAALWSGAVAAAAALVIYGCGLGLVSIARGTVPLAIFGANNYASLMGRLAMPSLVAQACAPWCGALLLASGGPRVTLSTLLVAAILSLGLTLTLVAAARSAQVV